jgi:hypothetical protein
VQPNTRVTKRLLVAALALVAVGLFALAAFVWLAGSLGCEDAEDVAFDTVRCDGERGRWWTWLQALLFLGSALACMVCVVWGFARATLRAPAVAVALSVPALVAVVAIQGVRVADKAEPKLSNVRAGDCRVPCRGGLPVTFTLDRDAEVDFHLGPARFEDIGGRQYASGAVGRPIEPGAQPVDFEAGTHTTRVTGRIANPPAERGPLPAGEYELDVQTRAVDSGNQGPADRRSVRVEIR